MSIATRPPRFGLDFKLIEGALYNAYGPNWASTIYAPQNQFRVMLEVEDRYQAVRRHAVAASTSPTRDGER